MTPSPRPAWVIPTLLVGALLVIGGAIQAVLSIAAAGFRYVPSGATLAVLVGIGLIVVAQARK
ncbi:hypothetical protein [Bradyrhizobium tropiciagri]|uniref:hypothetical protein n=1 Tax=Bradyrhizobium tropiciagri TaxID=312253 RepID=UPI001009E01D|nr:hypothetical protein [Bradyrhizobium tropiciagri]